MIKKIAILVSGQGSLLEAMITANLPIFLVLADRECRALEIAKESGIKSELVSRRLFKNENGFDREKFTEAVEEVLIKEKIEVVAMAGFMTILSPRIFKRFLGRILNIHPSLLPAFKGDKAVEDALNSGVKETGTTIHIATENLDDGKILAQEKVPIKAGDMVETLWERIKEVERELYPRIIKKFAES